MSCSSLRDVPRFQNKNVSACRNRPRRFRLPTVGTITVGCQGLERSGKQKIFQALRNLEKFLRPLTANCYCATAPAHGRGSSFSRPRRAVCNTFPSPQQLRQDDSCVTLTHIPLGGMSKFFLTFTPGQGNSGGNFIPFPSGTFVPPPASRRSATAAPPPSRTNSPPPAACPPPAAPPPPTWGKYRGAG